MAPPKGIIRWQTLSGEPITVGDVTITPQSQALIIRLPFGGLVWNRPVAVLVEHSAPITSGDYTIITASEVSAGIGFGYGLGGGVGPKPSEGETTSEAEAQETQEQPSGFGGGGGGGGAAMARPVAVISVGPQGGPDSTHCGRLQNRPGLFHHARRYGDHALQDAPGQPGIGLRWPSKCVMIWHGH